MNRRAPVRTRRDVDSRAFRLFSEGLGKAVPRRDFLTRALGWLSAAIAAVIGVPAAAMIVSPTFRKGSDDWSPIARLGEPGPGEPDLSAVGQPILTYFKALRSDAYVKPQLTNVPVFVINHGEDKFTVFDVRCTHLGCPVSYDDAGKQFLSPCHNGVFDIKGNVVAGPPPRPLDQYQYKVEDGVLFAGPMSGGHALGIGRHETA